MGVLPFEGFWINKVSEVCVAEEDSAVGVGVIHVIHSLVFVCPIYSRVVDESGARDVLLLLYFQDGITFVWSASLAWRRRNSGPPTLLRDRDLLTGRRLKERTGLQRLAPKSMVALSFLISEALLKHSVASIRISLTLRLSLVFRSYWLVYSIEVLMLVVLLLAGLVLYYRLGCCIRIKLDVIIVLFLLLDPRLHRFL